VVVSLGVCLERISQLWVGGLPPVLRVQRCCTPRTGRKGPTHILHCVLVLLCASACASTTSTTRELPVGMGTLGSYLDGCQAEAGDDGIARTRCPDGIMLAARTRTVGVAEPAYRAEAFGMASLVPGGRLVWDQVSVATEGPSGLVDRARALTPGTDVASATLVGVVRSVGANDVEEVWCSASDAAGAQRCQDLLGVVLSRPTESAPSETSSTTSGEVAATSAKPSGKNGAPVTLFGRSVSLPTTCAGKAVDDGVDAKCEDGASLSWRKFEEMSEATSMLHATLEALGDSSEGEAYPCTIAGESAQCEEHERAAAGLAYVDAKPIAVLCLNVDAPRAHSLCKAVLVPKR
jgi:hypothetical protein